MRFLNHFLTKSQEQSDDVNGEGSREGVGGGGGEGEVVHALLGGTVGVASGAGLGGVVNPELAGGTEEALIEKTLLSIQEKVCFEIVFCTTPVLLLI